MLKESQTQRDLPNYGHAELKTGQRCERCGNPGIIEGRALDIGKLYETATATFCPKCHNLHVTSEECNTYGGRDFLPVMRQKLIDNPRFLSSVYENGTCPVCGKTLYSFCKDLGGIDYYDNTWTVCINPQCDFPGGHEEKFKTGPYY